MSIQTEIDECIRDSFIQSANIVGLTVDQVHELIDDLLAIKHAKPSVYFSASLSVGDVLRPKRKCCLYLDTRKLQISPKQLFVVCRINDSNLDHTHPQAITKKPDNNITGLSVFFLEYKLGVDGAGKTHIPDIESYEAIHCYSQPDDVTALTMNCFYWGNIKNALEDQPT